MRDRTLVPVLGLCLLVATTAYLMVFTLLGQIGATLGASRTALDWITIATVIVGTVSSALMPALGAVLGERRLMVISMGCLAAGSLASALAPDVAVLLVGRVVAAPGLAAAALSIAIVRERRSGPGLARALGVIAAFEGAAAGTGFALGGVVEEAARADWRAVFLAMAAISAVAAAVAAVTVPDGPVAAGPAAPGNAGAVGEERGPPEVAVHRHLDLGGAVLLAGGLTAGLLAITEGAAWGWTSARTAGLIAAAVTLLAVWAVSALRAADPLVRLQVLARPGVAVGAAFILVTACTVGIVNLTVPSFLEAPPTAGYGDGASVLTAGLDMLPFAVAITLAGYLAGRLAPAPGTADDRGRGPVRGGARARAAGRLRSFGRPGRGLRRHHRRRARLPDRGRLHRANPGRTAARGGRGGRIRQRRQRGQRRRRQRRDHPRPGQPDAAGGPVAAARGVRLHPFLAVRRGVRGRGGADRHRGEDDEGRPEAGPRPG